MGTSCTDLIKSCLMLFVRAELVFKASFWNTLLPKTDQRLFGHACRQGDCPKAWRVPHHSVKMKKMERKTESWRAPCLSQAVHSG